MKHAQLFFLLFFAKTVGGMDTLPSLLFDGQDVFLSEDSSKKAVYTYRNKIKFLEFAKNKRAIVVADDQGFVVLDSSYKQQDCMRLYGVIITKIAIDSEGKVVRYSTQDGEEHARLVWSQNAQPYAEEFNEG